MNWRPIATAPRDGTPVDLWHKLGFREHDTWWDTEDQCLSCVRQDSEFTHWMLVMPPSVEDGERE